MIRTVCSVPVVCAAAAMSAAEFHQYQLGIALIEILDLTTGDETVVVEQPAHGLIRGIRRREQFRGSALRLQREEDCGPDSSASRRISHHDERDEGLFEERVVQHAIAEQHRGITWLHGDPASAGRDGLCDELPAPRFTPGDYVQFNQRIEVAADGEAHV